MRGLEPGIIRVRAIDRQKERKRGRVQGRVSMKGCAFRYHFDTKIPRKVLIPVRKASEVILTPRFEHV
jgi:hypothetical protein